MGNNTRTHALHKLRAAAPGLLEVANLSLKWAEGQIYRLPRDADPTDRKALETWAARLREAIAKATGKVGNQSR